MKSLTTIMCAATVGMTFAATSASAATYQATSAIGGNADHSMWLSQGLSNTIGKDFDFVTPGIMTVDASDNGTLTGTAVSQSNAAASFDVEFNFSSASTLSPEAKFKSEGGSAFNMLDGFFLNMTGGTLTGTGLLAGLNINVTLMRGNGDYAVQVGSGIDATTRGANNKNTNFGMAYWFAMTTDQAAADDCAVCDDTTYNRINGRQGDINVDLTAVPVPASALLLLTGVGAAAGLRRKAKAKSKA